MSSFFTFTSSATPWDILNIPRGKHPPFAGEAIGKEAAMIVVRVSAYTGVRGRVGREISKGDLIGVDPDTHIEAAEIAATLQGRGRRAKR